MNTYAIIENGQVANLALATEPLADNWIIAGQAQIGWSYADGAFVPPPPPPEPPPPGPPPVPQTVSRFQARAALFLAGKLADAEAAVEAAAADNPLIALAWREAIEWKRTSPALNALAAQIGMTGADVDNLFRVAATLEA
jgi:hypothetical protein